MLTVPGDIVEYLKKVNKDRCIEDVTDRINCSLSCYVLILIACYLTGKQTFGQNIACLAPAESPGSWVKYYEDSCYIQNKYTVDVQTQIHRMSFDNERYGNKTVNNVDAHPAYYQWVPFILLVQGCLFILPRAFWYIASNKFSYGEDVNSICKDAASIKGKYDEKRERAIDNLASFMCKGLRLRSHKPLLNGSLTVCYVLRKWLTLFIVIFQLVAYAYVIPYNFDLLWGIKLLSYRWKEVNSNLDEFQGFFPRVVKCNVFQEETGKNTRKIELLCVLMQNFLNEMVFASLYFWLLFLLVINTISVIKFTLFLFNRRWRHFMADYLPHYNVLHDAATAVFGITNSPIAYSHLPEYYLDTVLRTDGILLMIFMHRAAGGTVMEGIVISLWKKCVEPPIKVSEMEIICSQHRMSEDLEKVSEIEAGDHKTQMETPVKPCPHDTTFTSDENEPLIRYINTGQNFITTKPSFN